MKKRAWLCGALGVAAAVSMAAVRLPHAAPAARADEAGLSDQELLGKRLFEDARLSDPQGMSCASCHDPAKAFQGNNGSRIPALALGSHAETFGKRNVPTIMYSMFSPAFFFAEEKNEKGETELTPTGGQFLDGRAADLAAQASGPMMDKREMGSPSKAAILEKVKHGPYADLAKKVYGADIFSRGEAGFDQLAVAIAAFESSERFAPFSSKFDQVLRGKAKFTAREAKGFELFKDAEKGNCLGCHVGDVKSKNPRDWLFTDFTYDALGAPRNKDIPDNKAAAYYDLGLCDQPGLEKTLPKTVDKASLCGAFKVPTLRNIAVTGPYMHNGSFNSLRDVVKFYVTRDTNPELWYPKNAKGVIAKYNDLPAKYHGNVNTSEVPYDRKPGETPRLTESEIDAIMAFLNTLTDAPFQK